jgi:hypothetical protein
VQITQTIPYLWKTRRAKSPANRDVNEAAKNIVVMDLAILQPKTAAGIYKKPIEPLAKEIHYEPPPNEVRAVVIAAWTRGGSLPRGTIEQTVPAAQIAQQKPSVPTPTPQVQ